MDITKKIVISRKLSVLEYAMKREGKTEKEILASYQKRGVDKEIILTSHQRQLASFKSIVELFDKPTVMVGDELDSKLLPTGILVIALGGDNYLQNVSHYLENQYLVGINPDPQNSTGSLTLFTADSFIKFLPQLKNGQYQVENWTRLQVKLNNQLIDIPALSEVYVGTNKSTDMSRYQITINQKKNTSEQQKSSGVIIATGTGTTGWFSAADRYLKVRQILPRIAKQASFVVREPYMPQKPFSLLSGQIKERESIIINWLAHGQGLLSLDSKVEYNLNRGDNITVAINDKPLKVIIP